MKVLFIGGTGTISMAITKELASRGCDLYLINRGNKKNELPENVTTIIADVQDEADVAGKIKDMEFDVVCDFIGFTQNQLERDYRLFKGKTKQFMYISSASAYNKPVRDYVITEGTALANPYWEYSRNKIACETYLMERYRENQFPVTIIRPSHTYCDHAVPMGLHGTKGSYQIMKRMIEGKPIIVHGDGMSLWTMTYHTDFAKGFIGLMGNPHAIGEAFQITTDESMTWNQIYQLIADRLGVPYRPYYVSSEFIADASPVSFDARGGLLGDKSNTVVFDNSKLKRCVPDFKATVRMEEGLGRAVDYVMSHPECQHEDPEFDVWSDNVIEALEKAKADVIRTFDNLER